MIFRKQPFLALAFAFTFAATACTTTDTGSTNTNTNSLTDSTEMAIPEETNMNDTIMNNGTGGDTTINNDGMKNEGGAVVDSNNIPDKDGRLPVRGK